MDNKNNPLNNRDKNEPKMPRFNMNCLYLLVALTLGVIIFSGGGDMLAGDGASQEATYTRFKQYVEKGYASNVVINKDKSTLKMFVNPKHIQDVFHRNSKQVGSNPYLNVNFGSIDELEKYLTKEQQTRKIVDFSYENNDSNGFLTNILFSYGPFILLLVFWFWIMRRMSGGSGAGGGSGIFNVGKSKAKLYEKANDLGITFKDVAGQEGAKQEVQEIVEFLKNPKKYTELGGKIPKGALLVGPPGTGKTMLAKAVAGEAGVPFFSMSGSEFVEMFVGMGASKVRDLFKQAKEKAPCIVFIDEIDAIGKKRDGQIGGNDEREQTLNQLLTEMDGFDPQKGVVILAATNRPDTLDKALLRPGRFDRRIPVELPDLNGRIAILKVHAKDVKMSGNIDFDAIARATSGASGAELANIINEAALRAVRLGRDSVEQADLEESIEVVIAGYQRKGAVISPEEKKVIAYHEIGHALVAAMQKNSAPVHKITIIPRTNGALGYTMQIDENDSVLMKKETLFNKIVTITGGRSAEELVFGSITSGAANDIEQATRIARSMVTRLGMTEEFDMMATEVVTNQYLGGDTSLACSQETAGRIDAKVLSIIKEAHDKARQILSENREKLDVLANFLLEKETITGEEFMALLRQEEKSEATEA